LAGALASFDAKAELWGYVDEKGAAHFASERVDARYELFSRSGTSTTESLQQNPPQALRPVAVPMAPSKLIAFFAISPSFKQVSHHMREAAAEQRIDFELLQALIATESGFNAAAVSPKGAVGLMQLMPDTAKRYGVSADATTPLEKKLTDPRTNIRAGARYLGDLIKLFAGNLELALAAYNAGAGAVQRAGNQIPNYRETQNYVRTVIQLYTVLKPPASVAASRQAQPPAPTQKSGELRGGATGRGNMLAPLSVANTAPNTAPTPDY
jgi:soluble lytic murein transglycosylase-like protein